MQSSLSYTAARRQLAQDGYRRVPHSEGATGDYTYHVYSRRGAWGQVCLVDLVEYPDGSCDIVNWRTRLA